MCETYGFGGDTMDKDYVRKRLKCFNATSSGNEVGNGNNNLGTNTPSCNSTANNNDLGSLRWADDLDLDLSNELSSNGYISDSLLTFPVFKQELPSPPQKVSYFTNNTIQRLLIDNRSHLFCSLLNSNNNTHSLLTNSSSNRNISSINSSSSSSSNLCISKLQRQALRIIHNNPNTNMPLPVCNNR
uniref:Uncharacterized protein n=1 Tax=Anopheles maculatus TaxID=74869 RepID=A0A182T9R6_9DIPT